MSQGLIAKAQYVGATADELRSNTAADKAAGAISQKALFKRRGTIELFADQIVLTGWNDDMSLALTRREITSVATSFTELYGRFIGGLLNAGKPLILTVNEITEIYLLIDRKEFMETTQDRDWERRINEWLAGAS